MELFKVVAIALTFSFNSNVESFTQKCDSYRTIFVPKMTTAIFQSFCSSSSSTIRFYKTDPAYRRLLKVRRSSDDCKDNLTIYNEHLLQDRINISVTTNSNNLTEIKIELNNVDMNDNGKYMLTTGKDRACFLLFVMKIELEPNRALQEDKPVFIRAHPSALVIKRLGINATMVWMLDGISVDHSAYFIEHDRFLWISKVKRAFHRKTVTYRAIQDDGNDVDVSYMLNVTYGPTIPLNLMPKTSHYSLISGERMPDIICTSECNPPCNVSWGKLGSGSVLSLGTVTKADTGEYTCTASRPDSRKVEHTINVFVLDDTVFTLDMLIGVGTIHIFITLGLGLCVLNMRRKKGYLFCCKCSNETKNLPEATTANGTNATTLWL